MTEWDSWTEHELPWPGQLIKGETRAPWARQLTQSSHVTLVDPLHESRRRDVKMPREPRFALLAGVDEMDATSLPDGMPARLLQPVWSHSAVTTSSAGVTES